MLSPTLARTSSLNAVWEIYVSVLDGGSFAHDLISVVLRTGAAMETMNTTCLLPADTNIQVISKQMCGNGIVETGSFVPSAIRWFLG